jgi:micrococcal nuclease
VPQLPTRSHPAHAPRCRLARAAAVTLAVAVAAGCAVPSTGGPTGSGAATLAPIPGAPERPTGPTRDAVLVAVVDGDTIRVRVDGVEEPVRYIGIDTPEPNPTSAATAEPFADEATAANRRLLEGGGRLVLERDASERDRFGRLLRHVWTQDDEGWTLVNLALVAEGYAQVSTFPPDVRYADVLRAAQQAAREAGRGLWGAP